MLVLVTTDNHVRGSDALNADIQSSLEAELQRFSDRITRVEVSLSDQNSHKGGAADMRCTLEARLNGLDPIVVRNDAGDMDVALDGAIDKLKKAIESRLGYLNDHLGQVSMGGEQTARTSRVPPGMPPEHS